MSSGTADRFFSCHRGTELWSAGSQTLLPAGWNPLHLWRYCHSPVPESKGGFPWAPVGNVGSSIGRICGGALALESLRSGLGLVCMGKARGQPSVHSGWTVPRWQTGQDNEPRLGALVRMVCTSA